MSDLALTGIAERIASPLAAERTAARHLFVAEVLFGAEAYEELHADWQRLAERQEGAVIFQTPALLRAWADHFVRGRAGLLTTVVVRHAANVVLIWPLFVTRRGFVRVACGAGAPITQYRRNPARPRL